MFKRLGLLSTLLLGPLGAAGQQLPVLTPDEYGQWERLGRGEMSPDGRWLAYQIARVDERDELRVRDVNRDSTIVVPFGSNTEFSADSRWLAYRIGIAPDERERMEKREEPVRNTMGLLNLESGEEVVVDAIASFRFSDDGHFLAMQGYAPEESGTEAADLYVRNLTTGATSTFGNVSHHAWMDSGNLIALTITTESGVGNGVQLYDAATGSLRVLESSEETYTALSWRQESSDLAVLRAHEDDEYEHDAHVVLAWRNLSSGAADAISLDPESAPGFPAEMRIVEHRTPEWSDDGSKLFVGLREREPADAAPDSASADSVDTSEDDEEKSDVQIWHANDVRIIPQQRSQETRDLARNLLAVWHIDSNRFVQLGTELLEDAEILKGSRFATETDHQPYNFDRMFGREYQDLYLVDVETGSRERIVERVRYVFGSSSTGRYVLYFTGDDYWAYDVTTNRSTNLTENVETGFANLEFDYPVEQFPPYRLAGWETGDGAVLAYDKYDIWRLPTNGDAPTRLTDGAGERVVHRYVRLDDEAESIDPGEPMYLSLTGERTKQTGVARLQDGEVERLLYADRYISQLARAKEAELMIYVEENFDESPDFYVAGPNLSDPRQVTETNPFQDDYAWGRSELVDFESATGRQLQAALMYPANYDPARTYPMIVYTYEIMSNRVHRYVVPSERSPYNFSVFTQEGYFVLLPDIVYRDRDPGLSAVEAVVPAVETVLETGMVDPQRIGLVGHSWGGYQATFIPTQTNIFAASIAGAPLTNFLSMMGAIHWNPGIPETSHWETGQARMGVPFWEDFEAHVRNSPAAFIEDLETPMLMAFGDADGVVDWHQGVEFYNFARRAAKEFVMLVYPGEDHGLRKKPNQIDYHHRVLQWFGHYLKGEDAPAWITEGVTHLERKREIAANGR